MFSNDIIEQILLRLPLKSVFRFKCVSKAWNSLISEPYFKHNYQLQSQGVGVNACGYFFYDEISDEDLTPSGPARFRNFRDHGDQCMSYSLDKINTLGLVVASCKGLLLLIRRRKADAVDPRYYYVFDPITRKYFPLPPTLGKYMFVAHGFLCEEVGHFTVVACTDACLLYKSVVEIETYSSKTGQWEKSVITLSSGFCLGPYLVAQVMGKVLYWWEVHCTRLLAYDPNDPKQHGKIIEFPPAELPYYAYEISETKEGYLQYYRAEYYIEIFVLNESITTLFNTEELIGQQRWNLIHKIDIFNHLNICPPDNVVVFGFNPLDPQGLLLYLHTATDSVILSYDYSNGEIDQIYSSDVFGHSKLVFYQHPLWPVLC